MLGVACRRRASPRRRSRGRLRSQSNPCCSRQPTRAAAVPLPPLWKPCHDWTAGSGRGLRRSSRARRSGMVALGRGPYCFFDRCAQPLHCSGFLALGLLDLPARQPPYHRRRTVRTGSRCVVRIAYAPVIFFSKQIHQTANKLGSLQCFARVRARIRH